jgi:hypothetical protein
MGFYHGTTRTPYQVQKDNGKKFDFEKIKSTYELIKPLKGKRAKLNVRPMGERNRSQERIVKVNDNEYYLTCDAYRWAEIHQPERTHNRAISFHLLGDMETVVVHTPRTYWKEEKDLFPKAFTSNSVFYFFDFNLPDGLNMVNYKSSKYVQLNCEDGFRYYTIEKGDITFTRRVGTKYWNPMVVHRETIHHLDKEKTKEWRATAKPLLDYLNIMVDMVEPQYIGWWENTLAKATSDIPRDKVFKHDGEEAPQHWFELAEYYKKRIESYQHNGWDKPATYTYDKSKLRYHLYKDLYKLVKPLTSIEIPLGTRCKDRFKSWLK